MKKLNLIFTVFSLFISGFTANENTHQQNGYQFEIKDILERTGPFFTADYLYWKIDEDKLGYAVHASNLPTDDTLPQIEKLKEQEFKWTSGFRVGAGYNIPYDSWNLFLNWTHLHIQTTSHTRSDDFLVFGFGDTAASNEIIIGNDASSKWVFEFNMIDFELGKRCLIGQKLLLRPHIGLKGGWIDQSQKIGYDDFIDSITLLPVSLSAVKKKNDFSAIGPRIGVDSRWLMGKQFSIFSNFSGALLYGNFDVKATYTNIEPFSESPPGGTIWSKQHRLRPTVQMLLGADWERHFTKNIWLHIGAAYELQYFWNQWQVLSAPQSIVLGQFHDDGDLTMHGLTVQLAIGF